MEEREGRDREKQKVVASSGARESDDEGTNKVGVMTTATPTLDRGEM